jgi:hypothetical protein
MTVKGYRAHLSAKEEREAKGERRRRESRWRLTGREGAYFDDRCLGLSINLLVNHGYISHNGETERSAEICDRLNH